MKKEKYLSAFAGDAQDLDAYRKSGGFAGLEIAMKAEPAEIIDTVRAARLLGRGGAGFDAGLKWSTVPKGEECHVICNADEGEPGTFKDRYLLTSMPLLVIEGLIIAGLAVGSKQGIVYVRGEYGRIIESLQALLNTLRKDGVLGESVLGSGRQFDIEVMPGGGSYVVGDETALLSSIMGRRGYPLAKPPYPTARGLWDKPTVINNVETLACVPLILSKGARWFAKIGPSNSPGPKLYSVSGHVGSPGVYEFPMGVTTADLIEAAGGVTGDLKAIQIGGTAGPVYGPEALSYKLDFASMREIGGALGSGAVVVMNTTIGMIHVLEVCMRFFSEESCGQCFACRYGTRQLEYMADRIASGKGKTSYLKLMRETVEAMYDTAFCPFGQSIRLPLNTLIDNFGDELISSIEQQAYLKEVV
jgi:NADH:ubiquinone oxidoreductase subunit F (NADH-binding)